MLDVVINGEAHRFVEGLTVLQALGQLNIDIPSVCYDPRVRPGGNCRLCSVQVVGEARSSTACTRRLEAGMCIETHTAEVESFRRSMLELLSGYCNSDSVTALPEKELHRWFLYYGVSARAITKDQASRDTSHPHFRFDPEQCIACCRCVRICEDLQGQFVWHLMGRGESSHLVVDKGACLSDSSCVGCGACVDACPTAALVDNSRLELGAAESWLRTTCTYCGAGCELRVGVRDGQIVGVRPDVASPVSKGHLCSKGRYAWSFGSASDRITQPLIRDNGQWRYASWSEALDRAAADLGRLRDAYGPDSIGVLGSSRATNEENYLIQKLARRAVGTNNVDCCARVCHAPTAVAMQRMLGTGAATNSFDDIEQARTILVVGANPTENHPIIGARIKQQVRRGARLVVIDPRRIELAECADVHLAPRPGTDIPLLHAIAHVIIAEMLFDQEFVRHRVDGFDAFRSFVGAYPPERAERICAVDADDIRRAARLYASSKPAMCFHGLGVTEHLQGTEGVMALVNLALLTGSLGGAGTGINPLRGQNNVQGAAVMGCDPENLTGSAHIDDARGRFEAAWGAPLPASRGLNLLQMMDAAADGRLKGLYVVGYDILLTLAKTAAVRRALERLEVVIVQDLVMNETGREFGTLFLPAATALEKEGTFMNAERRIQRVRKAIEPPGAARPDSWIVCQLASRLGQTSGFHFEDAEAVWDEVREVWAGVAGISYARLESGGLQWPCPTEHHPGTTVLHTKSFAGKTRSALECIDFVPTEERTDEEYPFMLMTGRNLYQFNAGTMTARTRNLELRPADTIDINPLDAARCRIESGMPLRVVSRHGSVILPARLDGRVRQGELFATFHDPARFVNNLTSRIRDRRVGTPEYKVTAVQIEMAADPHRS